MQSTWTHQVIFNGLKYNAIRSGKVLLISPVNFDGCFVVLRSKVTKLERRTDYCEKSKLKGLKIELRQERSRLIRQLITCLKARTIELAQFKTITGIISNYAYGENFVTFPVK